VTAKLWFICLFAGILIPANRPGASSQPLADQPVIRGQIALDTTVWAPMAYLSAIPDFTQIHTMSYETIIQRVPVDQEGCFTFNPVLLPDDDRLYRVHFSKKGDPPASLIIGSRDENHFFLIAHSRLDLDFRIASGYRLIEAVDFNGDPGNRALNEINGISAFIDTLDYFGSEINRDFVREAVYDKLRQYADTCSHPLVALYALYKSRYESDYAVHPRFYESFAQKWKDQQSAYFEVFRSSLPVREAGTSRWWWLILLAMALAAGTARIIILIKKKKEIKKKKPKFGCAKGQIYISPDFDEPLDDFKEYM